MTKVFKKKLSTVALSTLGFAGLLTASIACGGVSRYDAKEDGKLKIGTTWTNNHLKNLKIVLDKYNELKSSEENFMPWEAIPISDGYSGMNKDLLTKFASKDKDKLFNLGLNYNDTLAIVARFGMELNLNEVKSSLSTIDPKFFDRQLTSLPQNDESLWTIPATKSTEMITINKPLFAHVISKALQDGATMSEEEKAIFPISTTDDTYIEKILGEYSSSESGLKNYKFKLSAFDDFSSIIDLVKRINIAFPKFLTGGNNKIEGKAIFGFDAPEQAFYRTIFSQIEGDYSKYILIKKDGRSGLDYDKLFSESSSVQQQELKKNFDAWKYVIENKGFFLKSGSDYSSNYLKFHKIIFSQGSTAGYNYNFLPTSQSVQINFDVENSPLKGSSILDSDNMRVLKDISTEKIYSNLSEDKKAQVAAILIDGSHKNLIYKSTYSGTLGKYDYKLTDASLDQQFESAKTATDQKSEYSGLLSLTTSDYGKKFKTANPDIKVALKNGNKEYYFIPNSGLTLFTTVSATPQTMQENEMYVRPEFKKYSADSLKKIHTIQGPSFFGIHSTEKEDKRTIEFLKWLFNDGEVEWEITPAQPAKGQTAAKPAVKAKMTPIAFLSMKNNYITPINSELEKSSEKQRPAEKITIDSLKSIKSDTNSLPWYPPIDSRSSSFSDGLGAVLKAMKDKPATFEDFLRDLKKIFKS